MVNNMIVEALKKIVKWGSARTLESKKNQTSFLLAGFFGILEDILFWKKMWLSLSCIFFINLIFFMCIHREIKFLEFIFGVSATALSIDGIEAWLKYKHRTGFLKRLAYNNGTALNSAIVQLSKWVRRRWTEYVYLRRTNHTKAFLMVQIILAIVFLTGKFISGHVLIYLIFMLLCVLHKIAPAIQKFAKKIEQNADSDGELEGLIPEDSEMNIKLLSIEPEPHIIDDKQSLDYWKPEDLPLEEASDSSENSSLVTNLSIEKMRTFDKEVETSDSSEDEYIPLVQQKDQLKSTLEVQPTGTWGSTAYSALSNFTGAVVNMIYTKADESKRKRVSSVDSTDGFEMIDKNDLL